MILPPPPKDPWRPLILLSLSLMICHSSSATSLPTFTNCSLISSGCIFTKTVVSHACPFAIVFPRTCVHRLFWFCQLLYLVLLWIIPIFLHERTFVRIHLYILFIIHAHILIASFFSLVPSRSHPMPDLPVDTRVLSCSGYTPIFRRWDVRFQIFIVRRTPCTQAIEPALLVFLCYHEWSSPFLQ